MTDQNFPNNEDYNTGICWSVNAHPVGPELMQAGIAAAKQAVVNRGCHYAKPCFEAYVLVSAGRSNDGDDIHLADIWQDGQYAGLREIFGKSGCWPEDLHLIWDDAV